LFFDVRASGILGGGSSVQVRAISPSKTNIAISGNLKIKVSPQSQGKLTIGGAGTVTKTLGTTFGVNVAGRGHCAAVESGSVLMETNKGFTQKIKQGQVACSFDGDKPTVPKQIDTQLLVSVKNPRLVDRVKTCDIFIDPSNMLVAVTEDSAEFFPLPPEGQYERPYAVPQQYRVVSPTGQFKKVNIRDC